MLPRELLCCSSGGPGGIYNNLLAIDPADYRIAVCLGEAAAQRAQELREKSETWRSGGNPRAHADPLARAINVANAQPNGEGLAQVDPIFTWGRLAQRIPGLCETVSRPPAGAVYRVFVSGLRGVTSL